MRRPESSQENGAVPANPAGSDGHGLRIHVCMRERYDRPGGLHSYVRSLVSGQEALGLETVVISEVTARGGYSVAHGTRSSLLRADASSCVVEYHFAHAAIPFLYRNRPSWAAIPRVMHFHGPWYAEGRVQGDALPWVAVKRAAEGMVYARFRQFITDSDVFRKVLHDKYRVPLSRISTVHPGIDTSRFVPSGPRSDARRSLGLPDGPPLLLAVRRLEPRMGLETAIRALDHLPDAILVIAGTGSMRPQLEALVFAAGLSGRVVFTGRVPEASLPLLFRAADVSLVPTASLEGFGMVVLESMASGTPVVATRVGGLLEAMGPFAGRWTVPPGDARTLATAVLAALSDVSLAERVVDYAKSRNLESMARAVEAALKY